MVRVFIFILIFLINTFYSLSQHCCSDKDVFGEPEEFPVFNQNSPDGGKFTEFITENIKYPQTAQEDSINGRVAIRFWIDTNGYTSEHEIIKGIREDLDEEVLRVAKLIKFDKPAMNRGEPIGMCYQFSVSFRLFNEKIQRK